MIKEAIVGVSRKIDQAWFEKKSFESSTFYKKIGINHFRKFSIPTGEFWWRSLGMPIKWVKTGSEDSLKNMITTTKMLEAGHLGAFGYISTQAYDLYEKGYPEIASAVTAINILGNIPGVLLSRSNRIRTEASLKRMEKLRMADTMRGYELDLQYDQSLEQHIIKEIMWGLEQDGYIPKLAA